MPACTSNDPRLNDSANATIIAGGSYPIPFRPAPMGARRPFMESRVDQGTD